MKLAVLGDIHGYDVTKYESILKKEKLDMVIILNDCDFPFSLRQSQSLVEQFQQEGKVALSLPGNHDIAHHTNIPITSGLYGVLKTDFFKIQETLQDDVKAQSYLKKICEDNPRRVSFPLDDSRTDTDVVVMHAAYHGFMHEGMVNADPTLWARLYSNEDYAQNFLEMELKNYFIMIRGHDHRAWYTYDDPVSGIHHYEPQPGQTQFRLFPHRRHIVTAGALCHGKIATIDTNGDVPMLEYHSIL